MDDPRGRRSGAEDSVQPAGASRGDAPGSLSASRRPWASLAWPGIMAEQGWWPQTATERMPVPTCEQMLRPILAVAAAGHISRKTVVAPIADHFSV